ncbi:hypothetical protein DV736_g4398, partial [Chaetothyriales sp. CBS 134916]
MPLHFRSPHRGDTVAVFIHAGAGYHSKQNEYLHLAAVSDAARTAMAVLKNGGAATDAVEIAIRVLEDREITNAGFGSNLTMHGEVECDATLVDHLGRSGAVGAVPQIKNPIALARVVLQESAKPLALQRVPPNLLVGQGAADFAQAYGMRLVSNDSLVSDCARDRWIRWKKDLDRATREERESVGRNGGKSSTQLETNDTPVGSTKALSPPPTPANQPTTPNASVWRPLQPTLSTSPPLPTAQPDHPSVNDAVERPPSPHCIATDYGNLETHDSDVDNAIDDTLEWLSPPSKRTKTQRSFDGPGHQHAPTTLVNQPRPGPDGDGDIITDTVGAIAIDCFGRIAAGSSSGGIGMKHKGRCGPAALVGIGTAVIPADAQDPDQMCCASVTSGTGEHMATTMAAAIACDRIYNSVKKENGHLVTCTEEEAMKSVIEKDFMKHPGVADSHCVGAIGILSVKKSKDGIWFYFGHNTDSFALASMTGEEKKPISTMSRSRGNGSIAGGGRSIRFKYASRRRDDKPRA